MSLRRLAWAFVLAGAGSMALAAERGRSTADGLYSEAQAERGAVRYAQNCARCHGVDLRGTYDIPSLRGALIARWSTVPLGDLYAYIHSAMPMQAPGALSPAINADILAYILKSNGYPAGKQDLQPDPAALAQVQIAPAL